MKLQQIVAYEQTDLRTKGLELGLRRVIIPSGFEHAYIIVEEDPSYSLSVRYLPFEWAKKFRDALNKTKGRR